MSHPSRFSRAALAIGCSLVAHLLLVLAMASLRPRGPAVPPGPALSGGLRLSLAPDSPRRRDRALMKKDVWVTANVEPTVVQTPIQSAPALPATGGTRKVAPVAGSAAKSTPGGGTADSGGSGGLGLFTFARPPQSVVWVLDRSISMGLEGALDVARREIVAGLRRLPPSATFRILVYNRRASLVPTSRIPLLPAGEKEIQNACDELQSLLAEGSTDHLAALRLGLMLRPAALFLVTDAADLSLGDVQTLTRLNNGRTAIHVLELSASRTARPEGPAANLAAANGGTYRHHSLAR